MNILGPWTDPINPDIRVGAVSLVPLESGVDYRANTQEDESGIDLTALLVVEPGLSGNATAFNVVLNGPYIGFITHLQQRGRPLYDYGASTMIWTDEDSIDRYGLASVAIDMQYQADLGFALEVAQFIVHTRSTPITNITGFTRFIGIRNIPEIERSVYREISDRITLIEPQTGISRDFFINAIEEEEIDGTLRTTWDVELADMTMYWVLERDGRSELGLTTRLAFTASSGGSPGGVVV